MNRLLQVRQSVNLSQSEIAKQAGCSQPIISDIEKGAGTTVARAQRIVAALRDAGATNESGDPVTLDDVFPPEEADQPQAANA